RLCLRNWG
ncbi:gntP permease family protein, partial [Vibrio parahaemolyticus V-223/04]